MRMEQDFGLRVWNVRFDDFCGLVDSIEMDSRQFVSISFLWYVFAVSRYSRHELAATVSHFVLEDATHLMYFIFIPCISAAFFSPSSSLLLFLLGC